jgi:hypothetical protein
MIAARKMGPDLKFMSGRREITNKNTNETA